MSREQKAAFLNITAALDAEGILDGLTFEGVGEGADRVFFSGGATLWDELVSGKTGFSADPLQTSFRQDVAFGSLEITKLENGLLDIDIDLFNPWKNKRTFLAHLEEFANYHLFGVTTDPFLVYSVLSEIHGVKPEYQCDTPHPTR